MSEQQVDDYAPIIEKYEICIAQLVRDIQKLQQANEDLRHQKSDTTEVVGNTKRWRHVYMHNTSDSARVYRLQIIDFTASTVNVTPKLLVDSEAEKEYGFQVENGLINILELPLNGGAGEPHLKGTIRITPERARYNFDLASTTQQ